MRQDGLADYFDMIPPIPSGYSTCEVHEEEPPRSLRNGNAVIVTFSYVNDDSSEVKRYEIVQRPDGTMFRRRAKEA